MNKPYDKKQYKPNRPKIPDDPITKDLINLKKQIGRLWYIILPDEMILEKHKDQEMTLKLVDGSVEKGILKEITFFQIVLNVDGIETYYYKKSVKNYSF